MEEPLIIKLESARGEILNALQVIQSKYNLPASILDGIFSQVLCEIKSEEKIELINANHKILNNKKDNRKEDKE